MFTAHYKEVYKRDKDKIERRKYFGVFINRKIDYMESSGSYNTGFANKDGSIRPVIKIPSALLELNDDTTRDLRTAHGLMNSMNDILNYKTGLAEVEKIKRVLCFILFNEINNM